MDGGKPFQSGLVDALQGAYPQLEVGVDGVLDQHGDVHAAQRVGYFLHGKGVGRRPRAYPQQVDARLEAFVDVLGGGHFGADVHACLLLHLLEPGQAFDADAFEAAGLGARLPDAGAEYLQPFVGQLAGGVHHLFFGLGAARAGDDQRAFLGDAGQLDGFELEFHNRWVFIGFVILYYLNLKATYCRQKCVGLSLKMRRGAFSTPSGRR